MVRLIVVSGSVARLQSPGAGRRKCGTSPAPEEEVLPPESPPEPVPETGAGTGTGAFRPGRTPGRGGAGAMVPVSFIRTGDVTGSSPVSPGPGCRIRVRAPIGVARTGPCAADDVGELGGRGG